MLAARLPWSGRGLSVGSVSMLFVNEIDAKSRTPTAEASAMFAELQSAVLARRQAELRCARVLARLGEARAWEQFGCASVGELGERNGLAADEARGLFDLGRAIVTTPALEARILEGKLTVPAASCVAAVLADPTLLREGDDWIGWAEHETTRKLRQRIRRRREEVRIGDESPVPVSLYVRASARDDFQRARAIASRKAGRALTPGETFETVVDHYLESFDEDRVSAGARRSPPTSLVEGRYVPVSVRREIYERQGHECAVPFCGHSMFLEKAHLWAHASGGDREADNLVLLCSAHHRLLDGGSIRLVGTAAKPQFLDGEGEDMAQRHAPAGGGSSSFRSRSSPLDSGALPPPTSPTSSTSDPPGAELRADCDSRAGPSSDSDRFRDPPQPPIPM